MTTIADPGANVFIIDEPFAGADPTATDTLFLLSTAGSAVPVRYYEANTGDSTLDTYLRTYFGEGGRSVIVQGHGAGGTAGTALPDLDDAMALLPAGPGQVVAPEVVAAADIATVADAAWTQGKVSLFNGGTTDTDGTLGTLVEDVVSASDGGSRGAILYADIGVYAGVPPVVSVNVPWSITVAGMIAARDILTGNPGDAAAGIDGVSTADSLLDERTIDRRNSLKNAQVNTAKTVYGQIRNYGIRSMADLETLPMWWNWWGARVVMAYRARCQVVGEDFMFQEIDGAGKLIGRFNDRLSAEAKELKDMGALWDYRIDTGPTVNTTAGVQDGNLKAKAYLQTSENAEYIEIDLIRRALTASLA